MITTYLLDSSALPDPLQCPETLAALPEGRAEKICRLKHPDARRQSFGAGLLLQYILGQGAKIHYNGFGKPLSAQAVFNLSHSGGYIILSICKDTRIREDGSTCIGCDIETIKAYNRKTAKRFFTETEYRYLESISDTAIQAEHFSCYWTKKESVLKLTGLGMSLPMDCFDVSSSDRPIADIKKLTAWSAVGKDNGHAEEYAKAASLLLHVPLYFKEYRYGGCCITVCSSLDSFAQEISVKKACIGERVVIN